MKCENCNKEHDGTYRTGRFCSNKCAASFSTKAKRKEINKKVSETLKSKTTRILYKCPNCGLEKLVVPAEFKARTYCSRKCSITMRNRLDPSFSRKGGLGSAAKQAESRRSKSEIELANLCKQNFKSVTTNEAIFNGWDADILIYDLKLAILWNGPWHYRKITKKHSVEQVQNRDKIKLKEIQLAGWKSYVIEDRIGKFNKTKVKNEFDKLVKFINNE